MKNDSRSPFTHGMEIEQFPGPLPNPVREYTIGTRYVFIVPKSVQ